jgi:hypothetical protein
MDTSRRAGIGTHMHFFRTAGLLVARAGRRPSMTIVSQIACYRRGRIPSSSSSSRLVMVVMAMPIDRSSCSANMGGSGHDGVVQKIARFIPSAQPLHHRMDGRSSHYCFIASMLSRRSVQRRRRRVDKSSMLCMAITCPFAAETLWEECMSSQKIAISFVASHRPPRRPSHHLLLRLHQSCS